MPQQNRRTLKNYFRKGFRPNESNFTDLVDSTLNIKDDGFSRSPVNGVEVSLVGDQRRLISFFRARGGETTRTQESQTDNPDWVISSDSKENSLHFQATAGAASQNSGNPETEALTLTQNGRVGIHVPSPAFTLDVAGDIRSAGRLGVQGTVPADGNYHDIVPDWLDGCNAFEVMAGVGMPGQNRGRYALLHAFPLNTFNPTGFIFNFFGSKNRIHCEHAFYLSRGDRLKLQWLEEKTPQQDTHRYKLQIKSVTDYGYDINIQYWISRLWFDPYMNLSKTKPGSK